jgi:hypothetical protein
MKKLFISMLAVAALASCSQEDVIVADKGDLIGFNSFVENATRADYSTTDINTINVYGTVNNVLIYDHTPVTRPSEEAGVGYNQNWKCGVTQYWIEGANYKFAALVDVPKEDIDFDDYDMPASFTYTADGTTDVLYDYYATKGKEKGQNTIVPFTFKHLLAKAHFTVTNNTGNIDYTYSIRDVKVTGTRPDGTYTVYTVDEGTGAWTSDSATTSTYTEFASISNVAKGTPKSNADLLLIPEVSVGVSFTVAIEVKGTEIATYNYSKDNVATLAQNTIYNFGVTLTPGDEISFTVTAKPEWGAPTVGSNENITL